MKVKERKEATEFRKAGWTYKEILDKLPVSKSSLSYWLRSIELTGDQKRRIYNKNLDVRNKFVEYNAFKHNKSVSDKEVIFKAASSEIDNVSARELKLIGTALYWAEGYKADSAKYVEITNSDPKMIRIIMRWFRETCNVPEEGFKIRIQLHDKENIGKATEFWSLNTGVTPTQFTKPYTKVSSASKRKTSNILTYGICHIRIADIKLLAKIKGWINGLGGPIV